MKTRSLYISFLAVEAALDHLRTYWPRPVREYARIRKLETFYASRGVGNVVSTVGFDGKTLIWLGNCPMCNRRTFAVAPQSGDWACCGPCNNSGMPDKLEYLLTGDAETAIAATAYLGYPLTLGLGGNLPIDPAPHV